VQTAAAKAKEAAKYEQKALEQAQKRQSPNLK
jgi:hypothetical protein